MYVRLVQRVLQISGLPLGQFCATHCIWDIARTNAPTPSSFNTADKVNSSL